MTPLIIFSTSYNNTKKISLYIQKKLKLQCVNVTEVNEHILKQYNNLIICAPTYGCEELNEDMEYFLLNFKENLRNKTFFLLETGIPYGFGRFHFGAKNVLERYIEKNNLGNILSSVSLETFPATDYISLNKWLVYIENILRC